MAKPLRLLVVEDNPADTELLLHQLHRDGYQVAHWCVETAKALAAALEEQTWDLVVSDYVLPTLNGMDVLAAVRRYSPDLPFIMLSGAVGEEMAAAAMKAGANDFVRKGNLNRLSAAIDRELRDAGDRRDRRKLEKDILEISNSERARIGTDLHDTLGQDLTGIAFLAKLLSEKLAAKQAPEAHEAHEIARRINDTIGLTRALARGLMPVDPGEHGLASAISALASNVRNVFGIDCQFTCDPALRVFDQTTAVHLYQIARDATNNAISIAKARKLELALSESSDRLTLVVRDDGAGTDQDEDRTGRGINLRLMNHRARVIGGMLSVQAAPGGGTAVTCTVRKLPPTSPAA